MVKRTSVFSLTEVSLKFSLITGNASQNGRFREKVLINCSRCSLGSALLLVSIRCKKRAAVSRFSPSVGEAKVISMDVWQMRSIWQELKYREGE